MKLRQMIQNMLRLFIIVGQIVLMEVIFKRLRPFLIRYSLDFLMMIEL